MGIHIIISLYIYIYINIYIDIDIYIYIYIYIKLSTVALEIPSCPGEARGAGIGTVSSLERA